MPFSMPTVVGSFEVVTFPFKRLFGMDLTIETPKGQIRRGANWSHTSPADYGFIQGTIGADGDEMDCYIGPDSENTEIYVVNQNRLDSDEFDEHKCMIGFSTMQEAKSVYLNGHDQGYKIFRSIVKMSLPKFKLWLKTGDYKSPLEGVS
jgi:hypothetical protein